MFDFCNYYFFKTKVTNDILCITDYLAEKKSLKLKLMVNSLLRFIQYQTIIISIDAKLGPWMKNG
jgi:hypothetical protein